MASNIAFNIAYGLQAGVQDGIQDGPRWHLPNRKNAQDGTQDGRRPWAVGRGALEPSKPMWPVALSPEPLSPEPRALQG
eukprot:6795815-Pyramimonas_sp.AAC.1